MIKKITFKKKIEKAEEIFRQYNGLMRTSDALRLGGSSATLYAMRDEGIIIQENRGL
jgi:hypothetical protein